MGNRALTLIGSYVILLNLLGYLLNGLKISIPLSILLPGIAITMGDKVIMLTNRGRRLKGDPLIDEIVAQVPSSTPIKIYILEDDSINSLSSLSSIGLTRGVLDRLDREEIKGVLAHEIYHINKGDSRFLTLLVILVGFIPFLCDFLKRFTNFSRGKSERARNERLAGGIFLPFIVMVLLILSPFFVLVLRLISPKDMDYYADRYAYSLTKSLPSAINKALGCKEEFELANRGLQPLYFLNPFDEKGIKRRLKELR